MAGGLFIPYKKVKADAEQVKSRERTSLRLGCAFSVTLALPKATEEYIVVKANLVHAGTCSPSCANVNMRSLARGDGILPNLTMENETIVLAMLESR